MGLNILIVDDSFVMRDMIKKTLGMSNLPLGKVYEAENGQEGLNVLKEAWIDLALIDIHMPVMSGEELLKQIRNRPETADLAVIVVSSESNSNRINILVKQGAQFIHKPFTPEDLREQVEVMLGEFSDDSI